MGSCLGLDIGGANLKFASEDKVASRPFELWKHPSKLAVELSQMVSEFPGCERLAVTMTGELADCFVSRREGVRFIVEAVESITGDRTSIYYQTNGKFVDAKRAILDWQLTAASNWHALASWIGRFYSDCIVVDIGSTTADIVPVKNGEIATAAKTDYERLKESTLIYVGMIRTPVMSIAEDVVCRGQAVPLARELFATLLDVYTILEKACIDAGASAHTADNRDGSVESAHRRLAKMICLDSAEITSEEMLKIARQLASRHKAIIANGVEKVAKCYLIDGSFVVLGEGAWLVEEILAESGVASEKVFSILDLPQTSADELVSLCGPAYAVQQLAQHYR